jgi:hypothetical protein
MCFSVQLLWFKYNPMLLLLWYLDYTLVLLYKSDSTLGRWSLRAKKQIGARTKQTQT